MDKRIAGLLGAAAALTTAHSGAAAAGSDLARLQQPKSYAELLEPIPNAVTMLKSDDESRAVSGPVEQVRYYHHHHHHHHGYFRRYYYGGYYSRRYHHHHHHHHHHHSYYRR